MPRWVQVVTAVLCAVFAGVTGFLLVRVNQLSAQVAAIEPVPGPSGPPGPTGPAGPQGPAGEDGVDGQDGQDASAADVLPAGCVRLYERTVFAPITPDGSTTVPLQVLTC